MDTHIRWPLLTGLLGSVALSLLLITPSYASNTTTLSHNPSLKNLPQLAYYCYWRRVCQNRCVAWRNGYCVRWGYQCRNICVRSYPNRWGPGWDRRGWDRGWGWGGRGWR